ncbi:hypothetical protein EOD29_22920 [Mesorhizobium sp. M1A.T.Ca.IN.004.03.1.1]|uniref:hypothetical protein n=1 Tax=Mesorhizobium sp. M1A.T.Ca.IN.004.03.1.1 TaxID=2496795 RepID=UPI000FC9B135|nr:hypothetical protein [Mesorhizobium sp. M1A.T.Ca.IN.004.03.1.1]RUV41411.1 hypothetical protein EOD29_22920 [Mesorhizobium sp. M1A.T.Ca.IN.004.03.1.1]
MQKLINTAAPHVPADQLRKLATNVDKPNRNGIPEVWELYLFVGHLLAHGAKHETLLADGKRPDIHLPDYSMYVDVKAISDDHAHDLYPVGFFMDSFREQIVRRLPVHGDFNVKFGSRREKIDGQTVHVPVLPPKNDISKIAKTLANDLLRRGGDFASPFSHSLFFEGVETTVTFAPTRYKDMPLIGANFSTFTTHRKHDHNVDSVAKGALDTAGKQLSSVPAGAIRGVYLCDGGSDLWTKGSPYRTLPIHDIANRYIARSSKLDFIVLFTVQKYEQPSRSSSFGSVLLPRSLRGDGETRYTVSYSVIAREASLRHLVEILVREALHQLDPPLQNIESAYGNRMKTGSNSGFRGGMTIFGHSKIRIPARSLAQILAGGSALEILDGEDSRHPRASEIFAQFAKEGRTITKIDFIEGYPDDDDWVDITFGPEDAAISPLIVPVGGKPNSAAKTK